MRSAKTILTLGMALLICLLAFGTTLADDGGQTYSVTITNLTKKQVFSPPLLVSHKKSIKLFMAGQPASDGIAAIAEGGDTSTLEALLGTLDEVNDFTTGGMMIKPSESMTLTVKTRGRFNQLSLVGMLVSTNDAIYAINSTTIPYFGKKSLMALAYDGGSEVNTELCSDLPGPPCTADSGNARVTDGAEGFIHVHSGIHGVGDLNEHNMDFNNPVAKIVIKRMK